jgi:hypothetical protein
VVTSDVRLCERPPTMSITAAPTAKAPADMVNPIVNWPASAPRTTLFGVRAVTMTQRITVRGGDVFSADGHSGLRLTPLPTYLQAAIDPIFGVRGPLSQSPGKGGLRRRLNARSLQCRR